MGWLSDLIGRLRGHPDPEPAAEPTPEAAPFPPPHRDAEGNLTAAGRDAEQAAELRKQAHLDAERKQEEGEGPSDHEIV